MIFKKNRTCAYCSAAKDHINFATKKYCTFLGENKAHVYHYGIHICTAKNLYKRSSDLVKQAISADCGVKPCEIQSMLILSDLGTRNKWDDAKKLLKPDLVEGCCQIKT